MDARAAKLALARKKLKDHQEKKQQENIIHTDQNNVFKEDGDINQQNNHMQEYNCQPINTTQTAISMEECDMNCNKNVSEVEQTDTFSSNTLENVSHNDVNATEILISSKRALEFQINTLHEKLADLESNLTSTTQNYNDSCQKIANLENDLKNIHYEYKNATEYLISKDTTIKELNDQKTTLLNEKSNLQDQLEFTKSVLAAKEAENNSLHSQLFNIQNQLDATQLHLQQLTSGAHSQLPQDKTAFLKHENEMLSQKVSHLEQQLKIQLKDYDQLNNHYEHYVGELNDQLKQVMYKNEQLMKEVQNLSNRENSLIEQISDMEIRIQNYKKYVDTQKEQKSAIDISAFNVMQESYEKAQHELQTLHSKYAELQRLYEESKIEITNLSQSKELDAQEVNENISLLKLNADITSDKVAAQRATEQNKKLKEDFNGLQDALAKMTKDKLELTEKITAEKFLNRELTIKLAEIEEKANDMQKTLKAKDEEMIRLQTNCRIIEEKYNEIAEHLKHLSGNSDPHEVNSDVTNNEIQEVDASETPAHSECHHEHLISVECKNNNENTGLPKSDAMVKLQERFLKIMDEVADLSDEKHRLEHIITQLQNETDTICEYVALYQQQRCLLKKRDEERSAQMKMFQSECARLQSQLSDLTGILSRFAEDKQLSSYFQVETKHEDMQKVMKLLSKLKTNPLLDPQKSIKFNEFYPCSCCSGELIEV